MQTRSTDDQDPGARAARRLGRGAAPAVCALHSRCLADTRRLALAMAVSIGMILPARPSEAGSWAPVDRQITTCLKVLTYDSALAARSGDTLTVVTLHRIGDSQSEKVAREFAAGMAKQSKKLSGMVVRVLNLGCGEGAGASLRRDLPSGGIAALYLAPGLEPELARILPICRERRILSMTGMEDYIPLGVAVVVLTESTLPVMVNLPASRAEGAELQASFLQVCQVLR